MHTEGYIELQHGKLHYLLMGNGPKLLIAFHGYGNNADMFSPLANALPGYTTISVNLPYHDKSTWNDGAILSKTDLITIVNLITKKTEIDRCSLIGYSMGGRVCLCIAEQMPQLIDAIVLTAPDGLVANPFYLFVTKNRLGKWLFNDYLINTPRYDSLISIVRKLGIVSEARYKFAMKNVDSEEKRRMLRSIWPNMAQIIPDRRKLKRSLGQYRIPVHIFIGSNDKVIPVRHGEQFVKYIPSAQLHIVDKGHWLFDEETISKIAATLS